MSHSTSPQGEILVVGASGKTGSRVSRLLTERGLAVRGVSRSTTPAFDWNDPATWSAALDGVSAAYLTYYPDLAFPGAAEQIGRLGDELARRGISRVVLLSGRGEPGAVRSEDALLAAVPDARVVRGAFFQQNFTEGMFAEFVVRGEIALPLPGDVPEPFVSIDDLAEVVVQVLLEDATAGTRRELTGPESLTFRDVAAILAEDLDRPMTFREISAGEFIDAGVAAGMAAEEAAGLAELFTELLDGHNSPVSTGVEDVLGRPATSLRELVRREAGLQVQPT